MILNTAVKDGEAIISLLYVLTKKAGDVVRVKIFKLQGMMTPFRFGISGLIKLQH